MPSPTIFAGAGPLGLTIDIIPLPRILAKQFDELALDLRSYRVPLERFVRQVMTESLPANFEAGGRPAWEPLSEATLAIKAWYGYGTDVGIASGTAMAVAGQLNIWDIDGLAGEAKITPGTIPARAWYMIPFGSGWENSADSATGASSGPGREWAVFQDEDLEAAERIFGEWIEERVAAKLGIGV